MLDLADQIAQVGVHVECERIELVRPIESDSRHAIFNLETEVIPALGEAGGCSKWAHENARLPDRFRTDAAERLTSL
jgi:hypothetical protein